MAHRSPGAALAAAVGALLAGCVNMATPPAEIAPAYTPSVKYQFLDCVQLAIEADYFAREDLRLAAAQAERVKQSDLQAYWFRVGQGDGIEAAHLALVRGERDAVREVMAAKRC